MRLLLVDDDEILRCLLVSDLTGAGHVVDESVDGSDALAKIKANSYDAVICDWEMPKLDGLELCRIIRGDRNSQNLYFIMLTGKETAAAQADGYEAGVDAFLTKPCDPTDLLATLRTAQSISDLFVRKAS
jgi:DNA-binding response OmpR family regulator